MELTVRKGSDRFVAPGAYRRLQAELRVRSAELAEIPAVVLSAFDRRTRLLPFLFYDSHIFPAGAGAIASALWEAGFTRTRAVFELWNPRFRPSRARLEGRPAQLLLVSSMQINSERAFAAIREARTLGADRPLIIAGGPKATYEPYHFWSVGNSGALHAPDVAVTGESYVLLELLRALLEYRGRGETMRTAFERARQEGALEAIPGLAYLAPGATLREPSLIDTGLQRLVQDLDELPRESTMLSILEPPHWRTELSARPLETHRVRRHAMIVSLRVTHGCKFNCGYCPIPAVNQKSWRFRSAESLVEEIRTIHERYDIKYFFGSDDNFFNRRETAEALLSTLARSTAARRPMGERIRFATEATEFDTYRNRDLLALARPAGLHAIWFGIEDLTASLINKGQKPDRTIELFRLMHQHKISPMAMLMFHDGQPFYTRDSLYGLYNQVDFLRRIGAISMQITAHTPAVGTREYEAIFDSGRVLKRVGPYAISQARFDGNHVLTLGLESTWKRQLKLLGGYATFYSPANLVRAFARDGSLLRRRRIGYQFFGAIATTVTAARVAPYILSLAAGRLEYHQAPPGPIGVTVREPDAAFSRISAPA